MCIVLQIVTQLSKETHIGCKIYTGLEPLWQPQTQELKHLIYFNVCPRGDVCLSVLMPTHDSLRTPPSFSTKMVCVAVRYRIPTLLFLGETLSSSLTFSAWLVGDRKQRAGKTTLTSLQLSEIISFTYSSSDLGVLMCPMHLNAPRRRMWLASAGRRWLPTWIA